MEKISSLPQIFYSANVQDTNIIAAQIIEKVGTKGVISLEGPLGAGKTHFVKGLALALGITDEVTSPTFTLLQSYGSHPKLLHHADFYRLNSEAEALDLDLHDCFSEGLTVIEWGHHFPNILPQETLRIVIKPLPEEMREISIYFLNS
jgi:tRNA threonylcarbamoyladenosine biosynthesis protein TsaE